MVFERTDIERRGLLELFGEDGVWGIARVRTQTREHPVENGTEGIDVGTGIGLAGVADLLGSEIARGSHHQAGLGQAGALDLGVYVSGNTEVDDLGRTVPRATSTGAKARSGDAPLLVLDPGRRRCQLPDLGPTPLKLVYSS